MGAQEDADIASFAGMIERCRKASVLVPSGNTLDSLSVSGSSVQVQNRYGLARHINNLDGMPTDARQFELITGLNKPGSDGPVQGGVDRDSQAFLDFLVMVQTIFGDPNFTHADQARSWRDSLDHYAIKHLNENVFGRPMRYVDNDGQVYFGYDMAQLQTFVGSNHRVLSPDEFSAMRFEHRHPMPASIVNAAEDRMEAYRNSVLLVFGGVLHRVDLKDDLGLQLMLPLDALPTHVEGIARIPELESASRYPKIAGVFKPSDTPPPPGTEGYANLSDPPPDIIRVFAALQGMFGHPRFETLDEVTDWMETIQPEEIRSLNAILRAPTTVVRPGRRQQSTGLRTDLLENWMKADFQRRGDNAKFRVVPASNRPQFDEAWTPGAASTGNVLETKVLGPAPRPQGQSGPNHTMPMPRRERPDVQAARDAAAAGNAHIRSRNKPLGNRYREWRSGR